jgi:hypothetical protein
VPQLTRLVGGIDRDEDRADARGRVLDDDPLEPVRRPDADAVARPDAVGDQRTGRPVDLAPELGVRRAIALVADHQRLAFGETGDGPAQRRADRLVEEGDVGLAASVGQMHRSTIPSRRRRRH